MPNSSADMPISDTPTPELTFTETAAPASATPKWDKVEQERLTRRSALRKMGYTSGIALFSMFAVDDLARMAIKKMEQHKETRQIAETIATEFKDAGIAFANPNSSQGGPCYPAGTLNGSNIGVDCNKDPYYFCDGQGTYASCVEYACVHYQLNNIAGCENAAGPPLTTV